MDMYNPIEADTYDDDDGDHDGDAFHPVHRWLSGRSWGAEVLEETESEGHDSGN